VKFSEQEQADRLKQLNNFRDKWLIAERIRNEIKKSDENKDYVLKVKAEEGHGKLVGEEAKKAMENRLNFLDLSLVNLAEEFSPNFLRDIHKNFQEKAQQEGGGDLNDKSNYKLRAEYQDAVREKMKELFNEKKKELEVGSGKDVVTPKERKRRRELGEKQKSEENKAEEPQGSKPEQTTENSSVAKNKAEQNENSPQWQPLPETRSAAYDESFAGITAESEDALKNARENFDRTAEKIREEGWDEESAKKRIRRAEEDYFGEVSLIRARKTQQVNELNMGARGEPKSESQNEQPVENKPVSPESSREVPDAQKELESYFEQRIDKSKSLLQYEDEQSRRLDAENEILSEQSLLESIKNGVFPDEIRGKIKQELAIGPSEPIDEEDYQQHKEEYDKSKKEYEERKVRVERLVAYVDAQKLKSEANPVEQQKQPEARVEIPVPKKVKIREVEQNPQGNIVEQQQVQPAQETMPENKLEESASPEQEKFQELMHRAVQEGCVASYFSFNGEDIPNQMESYRNAGLGAVTDPRINGRSFMRSLIDSGSVYSDTTYDGNMSPFEMKAGEKIQEVISMSPVEFNGRNLTLGDLTGREEDKGKPVLSIFYGVKNTEKRPTVDYSGRSGIPFGAKMFLPAELARNLYEQIQQSPERIRQLLEAFNQTIINDPNVNKGHKPMNFMHTFSPGQRRSNSYDDFGLPMSEANVVILPLEHKEQAYTREDGKTTIKPEYIKKVEYGK
ncbi:MAG: hypothetical protein NTV36_02830, partial [Candidatus Staskawiczbacteria bacterium]|nr:hypothetical protein [Candidatus Staskawiczbacteria bacterium]